MSIQRKLYTINFDPTVIKTLDAHIIAERKRVYEEEGDLAYAKRCWKRWFFIEHAIKEIKDSVFDSVVTPHVLRRPYTGKLAPSIVIALDIKILEERRDEFLNGYTSSPGFWSRNRFIERAINELINQEG